MPPPSMNTRHPLGLGDARQRRGEVLAQLRRELDALRPAPHREAEPCEDAAARRRTDRGAVAEDRRAGDLLDALVARRPRCRSAPAPGRAPARRCGAPRRPAPASRPRRRSRAPRASSSRPRSATRSSPAPRQASTTAPIASCTSTGYVSARSATGSERQPQAGRQHDGQQEEQGWPRHGAYYMKRFPRLTHRAQWTRRPQTACSRPPRRTRPCPRCAPPWPRCAAPIAEVRDVRAGGARRFAARAAATGGTQPSADRARSPATATALAEEAAGTALERAARARRAGEGRGRAGSSTSRRCGTARSWSSAGSTASPRWRTGTTSARASPGRRPLRLTEPRGRPPP